MLDLTFKLMNSKKQDPTVYLDPITSEYYTQQTITPSQNYGGNNFRGGMNNLGLTTGGGINNDRGGINNRRSMMPQIIRTNTGQVSMVNKMMQNRQPYQYNAPSVASMFPAMAMPMMNFNQGTGGAGQFLGGLLGNSPMLSNAPVSSGAGRFA